MCQIAAVSSPQPLTVRPEADWAVPWKQLSYLGTGTNQTQPIAAATVKRDADETVGNGTVAGDVAPRTAAHTTV